MPRYRLIVVAYLEVAKTRLYTTRKDNPSQINHTIPIPILTQRRLQEHESVTLV